MRALALAAAVLLVFPAAAAAHVEMSPDRVEPGSFTLFTVLSPDESEQPLTGLRLTVPDGMEVDGAAATPGFTTELVRDQSHRIVAISWQGGSVAPDDLGLFRFSASVGSDEGDTPPRRRADVRRRHDEGVEDARRRGRQGVRRLRERQRLPRPCRGRARPRGGRARRELQEAPLRRLALPLALLLAAAFPATAQAHANLLRTDPAAGSVVASAPAQIVLHFDQQVQDVASTVTNAQGDDVAAAPAHTEAGDVRALVIPLRPGLPNGDYTVRWRIVSTDGHIISGVFAVGFGAGRPPPQAAEVQTASLDWPFLIARFAYFCGLALVIGGVVFRAVVWRPVVATLEGQPRAMADLRERIRATQLFTAAAVLMLAGGWAALTRQGCRGGRASRSGRRSTTAGPSRPPSRPRGSGASSAAGSTWPPSSASALRARSRSCAAAAWAPPRSPCRRSPSGSGRSSSPGLSGHAGDPGRGALTIAVDALHVGAAAVWIGGLAQLVLVVPHATRGLADGARDRARRQALGRFSTLALGSVDRHRGDGRRRARSGRWGP